MPSNSQLFAQSIVEEFGFPLTNDQVSASNRISEFLADPRDNQAFILRGYAGTGKTSLVAALVKVWLRLQRTVVLLAPTGRAAKVLSMHAGIPAFTIHKVIYRQDTFKGEDTHFQRGWNPTKDALFIVDEASMIASDKNILAWSDTTNFRPEALFGSGNVLEDLIHFVYGGLRCKMLFVGDTAQLPPIGENDSPALRPTILKNFGLEVRGAQLKEVVRQANQSAVLREATKLRNLIAELSVSTTESTLAADSKMLTKINIKGEELIVTPGSELIDSLEASYRHWGEDETIVITRSNKRANIYNNGIRSRILDREEMLTRGDLVMAVKNNYYWTAEAQKHLPKGEQLALSFIANGDIAEVVRLHNIHEMHGFTFADATLRFSDYDETEIDCRILLDTLTSESSNLSPTDQQHLFESVQLDYIDIKNERERMKAIRRDAYYNALQIKYAYAVTCHKAQGGQWHEVYLDQGYIPDNLSALEYYRWLYTAFTRTSCNLYLVNWPLEQIE